MASNFLNCLARSCKLLADFVASQGVPPLNKVSLYLRKLSNAVACRSTSVERIQYKGEIRNSAKKLLYQFGTIPESEISIILSP